MRWKAAPWKPSGTTATKATLLTHPSDFKESPRPQVGAFHWLDRNARCPVRPGKTA